MYRTSTMKWTSRSIGVAIILFTALSLLGFSAKAEPQLSSDGPDLSAWAHSWRLDADSSDSPEDLLEAMEVNWALRRVASVFTPVLVMSDRDGVLDVASESPLGSRVVSFYGDERERDGKDGLGRPYKETSRWNADGVMIIHRNITLKSGRIAKLVIHWAVASAKMESTTVATVPEHNEIQVHRVFRIEPPGGS
jgi:hypothetical protein